MRFLKILAPFWLALYITMLRSASALIFVPMVLYLGIWNAAAIAIVMYGVWGTVFYLILLNTDTYEVIKRKLDAIAEKKQWRVLIWLKNLFSNHALKLSPAWIVIIFIAESPLTGVPILSLMYPKDQWVKGLLWVWIGAFIEVTTWFVPIYGGGLALIKGFVAVILG